MSRVAVIGLGRMGARIARRLLDGGHELVVWNRSMEKAKPLTELGAVAVASPADAARRAEGGDHDGRREASGAELKVAAAAREWLAEAAEASFRDEDYSAILARMLR